MKNVILAMLMATTASIAAASGAHLPKWNHANDESTIPGLTAVAQPQGQRFVKSDRTEYVATDSGIRAASDSHDNGLRTDK